MQEKQGRLLLMLGSTGLLVGLGSLQTWWPFGREGLIWVALAALVWIPVLVRRRISKPFASAFLVALIAGILAALTQAAFLPTFLENHPEAAQQFGWPGADGDSGAAGNGTGDNGTGNNGAGNSGGDNGTAMAGPFPLTQLRYSFVIWGGISGAIFGLPVGLATWAFRRQADARDARDKALEGAESGTGAATTTSEATDPGSGAAGVAGTAAAGTAAALGASAADSERDDSEE
jgi:hypothetical protein